jgi:hypothetical protein
VEYPENRRLCPHQLFLSRQQILALLQLPMNEAHGARKVRECLFAKLRLFGYSILRKAIVTFQNVAVAVGLNRENISVLFPY